MGQKGENFFWLQQSDSLPHCRILSFVSPYRNYFFFYFVLGDYDLDWVRFTGESTFICKNQNISSYSFWFMSKNLFKINKLFRRCWNVYYYLLAKKRSSYPFFDTSVKVPDADGTIIWATGKLCIRRTANFNYSITSINRWMVIEKQKALTRLRKYKTKQFG